MPSQFKIEPHLIPFENFSYCPLKANSTTLLKLLNCSYKLSWFQLKLGGVKGGNRPSWSVTSSSPGIIVCLKWDKNQLNAMNTSWFTTVDRQVHTEIINSTKPYKHAIE